MVKLWKQHGCVGIILYYDAYTFFDSLEDDPCHVHNLTIVFLGAEDMIPIYQFFYSLENIAIQENQILTYTVHYRLYANHCITTPTTV